MFIFPLLVASKLSRNVVPITEQNFNSIVLNRPNNSVVFLIFHGNHCPACQNVYPEYNKAALQLKGIVTYGHVDCSRQNRLCQKFGIMMIPSFRVFHSKGSSTYFGFRSSASFVKKALSYIPDFVKSINEKWIKLHLDNSAVLFGKTWFMPPIWKAVAANVTTTNPDINFGWGNSKSLLKLYNITSPPQPLLFKNGEIISYSESSVTFLKLRSFILSNFPRQDFQKETQKEEEKTQANSEYEGMHDL